MTNWNKKIIKYLVVFLVFYVFFIGGVECATVNDAAAGDPPSIGQQPQDTQSQNKGLGTWFSNKIILGAAWLVYGVALLIGWLLVHIIYWIGVVASYNDFINVDTVIKGWVVLRDLCNLFFVLILLVIAFATILRVESYNIKKTLPKLLIMAVLINYSRTITGIIIDFSQVIMLTFVSAFQASGTGAMVDNLGIKDMLTMVQKGNDQNENMGLATFVGIATALIMLLITLVVMVVIFFVLLFRIMMLWIYTILSPIAFFGAAFPHGEKYASQWWSEFSKEVIIGPVLAFFIWLALSTAAPSAGKLLPENNKEANSRFETAIGATSAQELNFKSSLKNNFFENKIFLQYVITISLLMGGLMVSQQIGARAGGAIGKGMGAINKGKGMAITGGKWAGKTIGRQAGLLSLRAVAKVTPEEGPVSQLAKNWSDGIVKSRKEKSVKARLAFMKKMGLNNAAIKNVGQIADSKTGRAIKGTLGVTASLAGIAFGNPLALAAGIAGLAALKSHGNKAKGRNKYDEREEKRKEHISTSKDILNSDIDKAQKEKDAKMEELKKEREDAFTRAKLDPNKTYRRDREGEKNSIENEFKQKSQEAENAFKSAKETAENEHKERVLKLDHDGGEAREEAIGKKEKAIKKVNGKLADNINEVNISSLDPMDKQRQINKLQSDAVKEKARIEEEHKKAMEKIDNPFFEHKNYRPNELWIEAAKEGAKEEDTAQKRATAIAEGGDPFFGKSSLYSSDGQTATQKKLIEFLSKTDVQQVKAIQNLERSMREILTKQKSGINVPDKILESIQGWKQGLAAAEKGGVNIANFSPVIEVMNQIKAKGEDSTMSVDDYKEKVIKA